MNAFKIKIAGLVIEITTVHVRSYAICRDFIVEEYEEADISISISHEDIVKEMNICNKKYGYSTNWEAHVETLAVLRKIAEVIVDYQAILLHGAAICYVNNGIVFVGKSGIGKSTHITKWLNNLPEVSVINGDKPIIRIQQAPMICGTPWAGKENIYSNSIVPLKAIVIMERNDSNIIERICLKDAISQLLQQIFIPSDRDKMKQVLQLVGKLNQDVLFYRFLFNNYEKDAFSKSYSMISKDLKW